MEYKPSITLYTSDDPCSDTLIVRLPADVPVPDLSVYVRDKIPRSAVINGTWIFYKGKNFESDYISGPQVRYGTNGRVVKIEGPVSSVRCIGCSLNIARSGITLFSQPNYGGLEQFVTEGHEDVNGASFVITGNETWTLYWETDFEGPSVSYRAHTLSSSQPAFLPDYGAHYARAVRRGQYSENLVVLPPLRQETQSGPVSQFQHHS